MTADAALTVASYTDGEQFQRERRNLFGRSWLAFCASAQLGEPGAFVSHTIGGWPLFAQRGTDRTLRAFHNVCRHQGMPVIEKPAGTCEKLRCRYHGWTYDLAGALVTAPPMVAPADMSAQRLNPISLRESDGFAFVAVKPAGPAPEPPGLGAGDFAAAVPTDAVANWKTVTEALLADGGWRFQWPNLLSRDVDGARVVRQIVPRSFNRTRFVDLIFAGREPVSDAARTAAARLAASDKARAEALQDRRAAGTLDAGGAATVGEFHARVTAALS